MSAFVVVTVDESGPGLLSAVPLARGRTVRGVPVRVGDLPADSGQVRALAVAGLNPPVGPLADLAALVRGCSEAEVPVLGVGSGGAVVAAALAGRVAAGGETVAGAASVRLVGVHRTAEAADDGIGEGLPEAHRWLAVGGMPEPDGAVVLARGADGEPLLARVGMATHVTCLLPQLDAEGIATRLVGLVEGDTKLTAQLTRFIAAHHAAFVGRWVDAVVGRTEAETPWGRKGPPPVPRPEAYLNPS